MPSSAIIEFTEEEMAAVGLALAVWRATEVGLEFHQGMMLAATLLQVDDGVMRAHIDRVTLRMSEAEEEVFGKTQDFFDTPDIRDKRAQYHSHLDQIFAQFEEDGRGLFIV